MLAPTSLSRATGGVSPQLRRCGNGGGDNGNQTTSYPQLNKGQPFPRQQRKAALLALGTLSLYPCHLQPDWGRVTPAGPRRIRSRARGLTSFLAAPTADPSPRMGGRPGANVIPRVTLQPVRWPPQARWKRHFRRSPLEVAQFSFQDPGPATSLGCDHQRCVCGRGGGRGAAGAEPRPLPPLVGGFRLQIGAR